jgi:formylglycine-generating enzyme required for sulfatase activity
MVRAVNVFVSYSHKDESLKLELDEHLSPLKRSEAIAYWHDRQIQAGAEWAKEIEENLNSADIILLLISPSFINSMYCWKIELEQALKRHQAGKACVIPIILRPTAWQRTDIARLQAFPKDAKAITTWANQDEAFVDVVNGIQNAVDRLVEQLSTESTIPELTEQEIQKAKESGQGEQTYRDDVLLCLCDRGKISSSDRRFLDRLQTRLNLSPTQAQKIEAEAIRDVDDYRQTLIDFLKEDRLITPSLRDRLRRLQKRLNLNDEMVNVIEKNLPSLFTFSFEIITVNATGETIDRRSGQADYFWETLTNDVFLDMVSIPGGTFWMGAADGELEAQDNERPRHQVTIEPFFMGKFAVTQEQWREIAKLPKVNLDLNPDPSYFKGKKRPVEWVSWDEAVEFCDRLSRKTGKSYRLPTEAEWEYACRAGTETPFYFGETITSELVNYHGNYTYANAPKGNCRGQTIDVGSFSPNAFGLYDMHGNVWEWCADLWHGNYERAPADGRIWEMESDQDDSPRLRRGGSWYDNPWVCRSAFRVWYRRGYRLSLVGFRVVSSAPRAF